MTYTLDDQMFNYTQWDIDTIRRMYGLPDWTKVTPKHQIISGTRWQTITGTEKQARLGVNENGCNHVEIRDKPPSLLEMLTEVAGDTVTIVSVSTDTAPFSGYVGQVNVEMRANPPKHWAAGPWSTGANLPKHWAPPSGAVSTDKVYVRTAELFSQLNIALGKLVASPDWTIDSIEQHLSTEALVYSTGYAPIRATANFIVRPSRSLHIDALR